jgi:hypothetical protein
MTKDSAVSDGTVKRARASFKELQGFAMLFVLVALLGGGGMIVYGFTDVERSPLIGTGVEVLIAGLWVAVIARAFSVVVELLLELLIREQGS